MLGEFHERDCGPGLPPEDRYQTSFAGLRAAEKRNGLEPMSKNDPRLSANEIGRRALRHEQSRPENVRARESAIREALQRQRR